MTLLEVFIALAIFIGALAAISEIIGLGSRAAIRAQLQSEAVLRAETCLAEALAGIRPLESASGEAFEDDPAWTWSLEVADGPHPDVLLLTVTTLHTSENGAVNGQATLARMIRNPQIYLDATAASAVESPLDLLQ